LYAQDGSGAGWSVTPADQLEGVSQRSLIEHDIAKGCKVLETFVAAIVSSLVGLAAKRWTANWEKEAEFDYYLQRDDGKRIALEVIESKPTDRHLRNIVHNIGSSAADIDQFIMVSTDSPPDEINLQFEELVSSTDVPSEWIGVRDLPAILDIDISGDITSPSTLEDIQLRGILDNLERYVGAPIGKLAESEASDLSSQLPLADIAKIENDPRSLEDIFRVGIAVKDVSIVLSDIKSFSSLVKATEPSDLREIMSRYYKRARHLVWNHHGFFDKFVGDSVLAVFRYPYATVDQTLDAIRFSADLVRLGTEVFADWQRHIDQYVETGTRIGISTGQIWPLNIGEDDLEITFVGDKINLAARLESNSEVDGVLLSNKTVTQARDQDAGFVDSLALKKREVSAKGQGDIVAWQMKG
jgi:adenylate cyclase